ncbi:MAG: hypothetical protein HY040_09215 [Planctomycetes bacterium]|nr:hypothetical protein [Planctomycetota bacterium]
MLIFKLPRRPFWAVFLVMILLSGNAHAYISPASKEEIKEKAKDVLEYLEKLVAVAAKNAGENPNPVVGALTTLLLNSGDLICESWIIRGHVIVRDLSVAQMDPVLIDKTQRLLWRVERACAEGGSDPRPDKAGGPSKPTDPPDGPGAFHPRPGWTVDQEICARKCGDPYARYLAAVRSAERVQLGADTAKHTADRANQTAADLERKADNAEKERSAAREALLSVRSGTLDTGELARLNAVANRDTAVLRSAAKKARVEAEEWAGRERSLAGAARRARSRVEEAYQAYEGCIKSCQESKPTTGQVQDAPSAVSAGAKQILARMITEVQQLRARALADLPGKAGSTGNPGWPSAQWTFTRESVDAWFTNPIAFLRNESGAVDTYLAQVRAKKAALDGFGGFYHNTYAAVWDSALAVWNLHQRIMCDGWTTLLSYRFVAVRGQIMNTQLANDAKRADALRRQTFDDVALKERALAAELAATRRRWVVELWTWSDAAKARSTNPNDIHAWASRKFQEAIATFDSFDQGICYYHGSVDTRYTDYDWAKRRPYPDVQAPSDPGFLSLDAAFKTPSGRLRPSDNTNRNDDTRTKTTGSAPGANAKERP